MKKLNIKEFIKEMFRNFRKQRIIPVIHLELTLNDKGLVDENGNQRVRFDQIISKNLKKEE